MALSLEDLEIIRGNIPVVKSISTGNNSSSGEIEDGAEIQFSKLFTILRWHRKLCKKFINHNIIF